MLWAVSVVALLLILAIIRIRDNILAAVSLTFLGVAVAGAVWVLHPEFSAAFILITLVYVVAALTLVIVAAASLSEENRTVEMRPVALAALGALPLLLLPGAGGGVDRLRRSRVAAACGGSVALLLRRCGEAVP
ncbi:hypothetical protein PYWP30_01926 [Pyrobaculum sp. WP30]|nr:hypothetical protein PYWP30_01926 [Pyrobaculum sp. WP30]